MRRDTRYTHNDRTRRSDSAGAYNVTASRFKTPRRGYRIPDITRVDLKRTPFLILLPLNIAMMALLMFFSSLLYVDEKIFMTLFIIATSVSTWFIGVIHLTGFHITGAAAFGYYPKMRRVTDELIDVMSSNDRTNNRRRGS